MHLLTNAKASFPRPPACSTAKGKTTCGCTLPYLAYFAAAAAVVTEVGERADIGSADCETTEDVVASIRTCVPVSEPCSSVRSGRQMGE